MTSISSQKIQHYRQQTFRLSPALRVKTIEEAIEFVNNRGFVHFWPIKGIVLPSLWAAVAGDRPVADAHDDPGHVTWGWKDSLLGGRQWYYAKVLRKKATMIAFDALPYFYALSENYGSPEEDYLALYEMGHMTQEAKTLYEALLEEGPLDTIVLKRKSRLSDRSNESRFNRALADLQADFKILPVAVTQAGGWRYAFAYDIAARHYPELVEISMPIKESTARVELARVYLNSLGAATLPELTRLFGWSQRTATAAVETLVDEGHALRGLSIENQFGEGIALSALIAAG